MVRPSKTPTEVELKFLLVPRERRALARNPLLARATTQTDLSSVYYDTPGWALRKQGITLRVRRVNGAFLQTIKSEAGSNLFDRGEWETKIHGAEPDRFAFAGTPAEDILGAKGVDTLIRLFSTEVQRTSRIVKEGSDRVEVSLDHGEIVAGALRQPIDELEFELKGGDADGLFAVARRFAGDAVLRLSFESKAERGYRLVAEEAPAAQNGEAVHIRGDTTGADAFALVMRACLAQVCGNANLLARGKILKRSINCASACADWALLSQHSGLSCPARNSPKWTPKSNGWAANWTRRGTSMFSSRTTLDRGKTKTIPGYAHSATGSMPHNTQATIVRSWPSIRSASRC